MYNVHVSCLHGDLWILTFRSCNMPICSRLLSELPTIYHPGWNKCAEIDYVATLYVELHDLHNVMGILGLPTDVTYRFVLPRDQIQHMKAMIYRISQNVLHDCIDTFPTLMYDM